MISYDVALITLLVSIGIGVGIVIVILYLLVLGARTALDALKRSLF